MASYRECRVALLWTSFVCTVIFMLIYPAVKTRTRRPAVLVWPSWVSRDARLHIRPEETTALMTPECIKPQDDPINSNKLLVVVCSALANEKERASVRKAWAAPDLTPEGVKVIFLVGRDANDTESPSMELKQEQNLHGDILQEDFVDNYANLSVKSLFLLKTVSSQSFPFPYVLKTDDDVYVNLRSLTKEVDKHAASGADKVLQGNLICGAKPIRDPYNKWYAPHHMFRESVYPNYLSGTAYLMSKKAAVALLTASMTAEKSREGNNSGGIFHLEDIYVTGVLARRAHIRPRDHPGFTYTKRPLEKPCLYVQAFSSHGLKPREMELAADRVRRAVANCKKIPTTRLRGYGPGKCKWN